MRTIPLHILRHALIALLALTLLSLPFAHRVGASPVSAEMTQYLASGGTLTELCGTDAMHLAGGCESCRIVNATMLPPASAAWQPAAQSMALRIQPLSQHTHDGAPAVARPPARAPPAV